MRLSATRFLICLSLVALCVTTADARRLKVRSFSNNLAPGQIGTIIFDNPRPDEVRAEGKCTADKLIAWVKSDIPILRIEQNGKQVWTSLGSYQTLGDSCIASFMVPTMLVPGEAVLFLVNDRDNSTPYKFNVGTDVKVSLKAVDGGAAIAPLSTFRLIGEGFVPAVLVDKKAAVDELEHNLTISKMTKPEQFVLVNKRMEREWDKLSTGNFLTIKQAGKSWRAFVEQCGLTDRGLTLEFIAPPDIKSGPAEVELTLRVNDKEAAKSTPLTVMIQ